ERAVLRSVVGRRSRKDTLGRDRKIVHDHRTRLHQGQRCAGDQEHPSQIRINHIFPALNSKLVDIRVFVRNTGVVYENIELSEFLPRGGEQLRDRIGVTDITRSGQHTHSASDQFPSDIPKRSYPASGQHQTTLLAGKRPSYSQSDATTGARYQSDFAVESAQPTPPFRHLSLPEQTLDSIRPVMDKGEEFGARLLLLAETAEHGRSHGG